MLFQHAGGFSGAAGGRGSQPQMRIHLIQQLEKMGFMREEAQKALINNNMQFDRALGELREYLLDLWL